MWAALTTQARLAMVTARELSYADLTQLLRDLKTRAHEGGHVGNAAAAQLLALAQAAIPNEADEDGGDDISSMNAAQRAARRALLQRIREEADAAAAGEQ
jgi:hypothetical protein